jgi:hypothetical protein
VLLDRKGEVTYGALRTLLGWIEVMRPALTAPGLRNAVVLFSGWVLTGGTHAVTQALVTTDVARRRHHEAFHRFFSRGTWHPDRLGELLFRCIVRLVPPGAPIQVALDDTLAAKKGPRVFGIGTHLDAVRSTRRVRVFCFGHVWVVLAIVVRLPFSQRAWALPVLFRLYRNEKECRSKHEPHRKKTELAREIVDVVARWAAGRVVHLAADSAYCNDTLMRGLSRHVVVFGSMRPDAVLTAPPTDAERKKTGRRRVKGRLLPKPDELARDPDKRWQTCEAVLYGRRHRVRYKSIDAQWYRACGTRLIRVVIVRVDGGSVPWRVFCSTDASIPVASILETYAGRWSIEVCFRDLKQLLGFADSSARRREAVERTAPFVGFIYTILVLWFADSVWRTPIAAPPVRPWYTTKKGHSFADILRAAQRALLPLDVLDPARSLRNLQKSAARRPRSTPTPARTVT